MEPRRIDWKLVAVLVLALLAVTLGLFWLGMHDFNLRRATTAGIALLQAAGPWAFFSAMAVLPAVGCPMLVFYLTAAGAFTARLGLGGVLAAIGAALALNLALAYWLARYGLRPWLEKLVARTTYRIPALDAADHAELTVIVRVTPGPPFFLQSYLLGLAGVRFGTYLWISWVISMAYATGFTLFGDAILHGRARLAIVALSVLVAVALFVHLLRRHYGKKRT